MSFACLYIKTKTFLVTCLFVCFFNNNIDWTLHMHQAFTGGSRASDLICFSAVGRVFISTSWDKEKGSWCYLSRVVELRNTALVPNPVLAHSRTQAQSHGCILPNPLHCLRLLLQPLRVLLWLHLLVHLPQNSSRPGGIADIRSFPWHHR